MSAGVPANLLNDIHTAFQAEDGAVAAKVTEKDLVDRVMAAFGLMGQGKWDEMLTRFHPEVEFRVVGLPPFEGMWRGPQAVVDAVRCNLERVEGQALEVASTVAQGNQVAILMNAQYTEGKSTRLGWVVFWFTFRDGLIVKVLELGSVC